MTTSMRPRSAGNPCVWCGRAVAAVGVGRRRRYCCQSCRQRAYEQRSAVKGTAIPADAVILTAGEASELVDRMFEVRCAAEDVATAVAEGADTAELISMCEQLTALAREAERFR
ncbi:hypothetical protein B2J88_14550 [Rhodococcus sp. SRB_17]|nr:MULTISPECIES: hypothetical protein [unclassified Rhodococcus (in: high G+C Gram-positive bacteria)]MCJ0905880.1 hypothetical protein [Rhodococcus sp. ARC_M6]NMM85575.1 hypothetical protein [Rhodococcus sp. SRB_17]